MLIPCDKSLFKQAKHRTLKRFGAIDTWKATFNLICYYMKKGGEFRIEFTKANSEEAALKTIEDALTKKGFTKINDDSFIIGNSLLSFRTLSNLFEISKKSWYQYVYSDPVALKSKATQINLAKNDYFGIVWINNAALVHSAIFGDQPVKVPLNIAYSLIASSRELNAKERQFRSRRS